LELADILGAKHYRLFSFYDTDESDACFDLVCERIQQFVDAAKGSGVLLCHKNEKGIYGDTAAKCLKIHKALPDVKAIFDPANYLQCGEVIPPAWELISPHVEYLYIKDCAELAKRIKFRSGVMLLNLTKTPYIRSVGRFVGKE
jgi:sugar phosphate isomerase/epimerase